MKTPLISLAFAVIAALLLAGSPLAAEPLNGRAPDAGHSAGQAPDAAASEAEKLQEGMEPDSSYGPSSGACPFDEESIGQPWVIG